MWQISYPPANGASLGSYLSKNGCFWAKAGKMGPIKMALAPKPANFLMGLLFLSWWRDEVKIRQMDRQTDRQIIWHHIQVCVWIFLRFIFATSLLASLAGGLSQKFINGMRFSWIFNWKSASKRLNGKIWWISPLVRDFFC